MHAQALKGKDENLNQDTSPKMLQGFRGIQLWNTLLRITEE